MKGDSQEVRLAYGRQGLTVSFPRSRTRVIEPRFLPGIEDQEGAVRAALRDPVESPPLSERVRADQSVAISICDVTRPMPSDRVLPPLLKELEHLDASQVTILVATGTHRECTEEELREMVGSVIFDRYTILNHRCDDEANLEHVGETSKGTPIRLNRRWLGADVRITTGFIEPHFFAGFSGGPKLVAPGLAALETVMHLHSAALIRDPRSTWGVIEENPIHSEIREIAAMTGVDFSVDVTINRDHEITRVFAGRLDVAHPEGCRFVKENCMRAVEEEYDVVVTTNSGYPLDLNLYQTVKGMSAAVRIVKEGGAIVVASECSDGIPEHGHYGSLLGDAGSPDEILKKIETPEFRCQDQWQAQIQAMIQQKARVFLKADGLTHDQIRSAHLTPIESVESAVLSELERRGPAARVCVLPEGPQTVPYLSQS